jgi:N-acetylglucosamine transport system substrate-binding protein
MKKKFLSISALSLTLASSLILAGCNTGGTKTTQSTGESTGTTAEATESQAGSETAGSSEAAGGEKRVLKIDAFEGGNGVKFLEDLKAAFEKENPDVTVEIRADKEIATLMNKDNATGKYADVVYYNLAAPTNYTETQLNTGEVMEISDVYEAIKDRMDPAFQNTPIGNYFGDGKQYLLPLKYTPTGFFYNTELIGEGKKYALPETWEDMWALGDQAKADGIALFTYPVRGYLDTVMQGMLDAAGGPEFLGKAMKYGENTWESEEGKMVLDTIAKLVSPDYLQEDTVANANEKDGFKKNQQAVIDGKALFMPNGDWIVEEMKDTTPTEGFHWGLMPLPAFEKGGDRVATAFSEQVWIPKQAANPEDAKAFLEFIYSEEGSKVLLDNGLVVPVQGISAQLTDTYQKEFFAIYDNGARASIGAFAPYDQGALPDVEFKKEVYGPIDELANGTTDVETWQQSLADLWTELRENPVK